MSILSLVHLPRFFRDGIQFGVYERKLIKNKVKVISITQPTSDDAGGEINDAQNYQSIRRTPI